MMRIFAILALTVATTQAAETLPAASPDDIVSQYPHLNQYLFEETDTKIRFGFGISPLAIIKNKAGIALSIFQIHLMTSAIDWELFNATFGTSISNEPSTKVNEFHFRTFPKVRLTSTFSIGPLVGLEFVSFPDVKARINKNNYFTPEEPLSSRGLIYGAGASQLFKMGETQSMRVNEFAFKQTYDIRNSGDQGWQYYYSDNALNRDPSPIEPGIVVMVELSFLY